MTTMRKNFHLDVLVLSASCFI